MGHACILAHTSLATAAHRPQRYNKSVPTATHAVPRKPRWYLIPVRALLVTFALTLLSFAISLFLGILGVFAAAKLRGVPPNMTLAYRHVALPAAAVIGVIVLISALIMEIQHYRQAKTLAGIERASRPAA